MYAARVVTPSIAPAAAGRGIATNSVLVDLLLALTLRVDMTRELPTETLGPIISRALNLATDGARQMGDHRVYVTWRVRWMQEVFGNSQSIGLEILDDAIIDTVQSAGHGRAPQADTIISVPHGSTATADATGAVVRLRTSTMGYEPYTGGATRETLPLARAGQERRDITIAHEIGHALGLADVPGGTSTMRGTAPSDRELQPRRHEQHRFNDEQLRSILRNIFSTPARPLPSWLM